MGTIGRDVQYMTVQGVNIDTLKGATHMTIAYGLLGICLRASFKLGVMFFGGVGGLD